ncbi:MAG: hypothetical protein FJ220_01820 [Kiritimatiellaceae bacterium]|nr:hypothetical protein [Kiritimatiellaceae bacterium]
MTVTTLEMGNRQDFNRVELLNAAGLKVLLYKNGGTSGIFLDGLMVNQLEGHPFQGGLDRVYLRQHSDQRVTSWPVSGTDVECTFFKQGVEWQIEKENLLASMQMMLHPELPILFRVCHVQNTGTTPIVLDWMVGQDLGLADLGALKNNEAYASQYLDHRLVDHPVAGRVVLSRNNLHPANPFTVSCCLHGASSASTDGYQFFGTSFKLSGKPVALDLQTLENRVRQYEFGYAALPPKQIVLQPGQSSTTTFALYLIKTHPDVSSAADLRLVDDVMTAVIPGLGERLARGASDHFFAKAPLLSVEPMQDAELKALFAGEWRHTEYSASKELYSFFCGEDTHVVLSAKEAVVERSHGSVLKSAQGVQVSDQALSVTCYGYGAFGSQFSVGNTTFGRFSTIQRNSLNMERSSGIRLFALVSGVWTQLGFPSVFVMERDRVRWIYKTKTGSFKIVARATSDTLEYAAVPLHGEMPALRLTWEVCGDPNEFDGIPQVTWNSNEHRISISPAIGSLLQRKFPQSCVLAQLEAEHESVGGAARLGGAKEPYLVMDFPAGKFKLSLTGHYQGAELALQRFQTVKSESWDELAAHFDLSSGGPAVSTLRDTFRWYAHNAMIHYAVPRGMEFYGAAAWGTRDVCQGPLEFLLALGHDQAVAEMLCEIFAHQYPDSGTWPQWFMFDDFREVQCHGSHGDVIFWPIKALCDYVEQTGDVQILQKTIRYTDPQTFAFTEQADPLYEHLRKAVQSIYGSCVEGTALPCYGDGDWNDSLQPVNAQMKTHMVSGWTAGLAIQALSALSKVWTTAGYASDAEMLDAFILRMKQDYRTNILKDGVAAGFVLFDGSKTSCLLHPSDDVSGIHYRLLPINQAVVSELFTPDELRSHLDLAHRYLKFPDGMRLMNRPPEYRGGKSVHFQRAETAAHFGREIGLQYVHANIRYAEVMAKAGRAEELLNTMLIISPVAIQDTVPNARVRQANLYFSSSDADVYDRYEAASRLDELKEGKVGALGGWRLYSSGPGIYIGLMISYLFGIRRSYGRLILDPVLPASMNGVELSLDWKGKSVRWIYHVEHQSFAPRRVTVNGEEVTAWQRIEQPYRQGGISLCAEQFTRLLNQAANVVEIYL